MATINSFEDSIAWQTAKNLSVLVYGTFSQAKDYGFKDQIQRAAVSVMNNIAEGFERSSNKELIYFLYVAKGSSAEVRSMLILAKELGYINDTRYDEIMSETLKSSKLIANFIKSLKH